MFDEMRLAQAKRLARAYQKRTGRHAVAYFVRWDRDAGNRYSWEDADYFYARSGYARPGDRVQFSTEDDG